MASNDCSGSASLSNLPAEILLHICSKLDFRSLTRLGRTCKTLRDISFDESLWKLQCETEFLLTKYPEDTNKKTWYDLFRWYHYRFGRYHSTSVYRTIRRLWDRLEKYLQENDPHLLESLRGPCDMSEILISEEKMKCRFPPDLRCSLQIHNGQQMTDGIGLLGTVAIASYYRSEGLADAATMARCFDHDPFSAVPGCVPLTQCFISRHCQFIGISDVGGFTVGEVFYPIITSESVDVFVTGKSFEAWFTDLVYKLENDLFVRYDNRIFRYEHDPDCVARSHDCFTVKVSTSFLPENSKVSPGHFVHLYRITMSMDEDADHSMSCQLETRHWIITDMDGKEEHVDGEGVVGEFPTMTPGASYSWVSCTSFRTTYGSMRGSFTMKNLQTGDEIEIMCPTFNMKCLPYKLGSDRNRLLLERKKKL